MERDQYEKNQTHSALVAYLHSIRFSYLLNVFDRLPKGRRLRVVDIGCAHAKTFGLLNARFPIDYLGIELDREFAAAAVQRYGGFQNFRMINDSIEHHYDELAGADAILALETIEHIPEHLVVRLVEQIAAARPAVFMCSVPNEVGPIVWVKNLGSFLTGYVRHREYTWPETFYAGIFQLNRIPAHGTGHKGFDWRWLAQTIRHNMKITRMLSSPFPWLPKTLSFSVVFVCWR